MSDTMKKELSININTNVNTEPIKKARNEIEAFRQECEGNSIKLGIDKKSLQVDTRGFYKAINAAKALEDQLRDIQKTAPQMMGAFEDSDSGFGFANKFREELKDAIVTFNDKSVVSGFDNIVSKISEGFSVLAVDLGNRANYIREQISSALISVERFDGSRSNYYGKPDLLSGKMDIQQLEERIELTKKLFEYQNELEHLNGQRFKPGEAPLGVQTSSQSGYVNSLQGTLNELREYNLQTTEQLKRRKELIREAKANFWTQETQDSAKENAKNEELYESNIGALESFIRRRQNIIEQLKANKDELFSMDGISQYVEDANSEIKKMEGFIKELQNIHDGKTDDPQLPIIGDFSSILEALGQIERAVRDVSEAFKPLTDALSLDGSMLNQMVTSTVSDLNVLEQKFKHLSDTIDEINKKEFNITQNFGSSTAAKGSASVEEFRKQAQQLYDVINLMQTAIGTAFSSNRGLNREIGSYWSLFAENAANFADDNYGDRISSVKTSDTLKKYIVDLTKYKDAFLSVINEINKIKPGEIDPAKFLGGETEDGSQAVVPGKLSAEEILEQIKLIRQKITNEFSKIGEQINNIFDFSKLNPDYSHIETITANIYQKFLDLQGKLGNLEIKFKEPKISDDLKSEPDSIKEATDAMEQEGRVAGEAVPKKNAFTKANKKAAESMEKTGASGDVASDGIKKETESLEEAEKKRKEIADAAAKRFKDVNKANVKDTVRLGGVTQKDFERYANEIAETKGLKVGPISVAMDTQGKMMTASVQMLNEELAQSITYTYRLMELEKGVAEAYLVGYKAKGDQNKALKQEAAAKKKEDAERLKADKERAKNNQWLIKQQGKLDTQERKYKYSNKSIDGTSSLMSDETSLADDVDKTIDNLTQHIRERIKSAMGGALTDELKEEISNDLRILQNEIAVQQNEKYSATNMKASTVEKNKDAYTEYLNAFEANAKKANVFDQMKESIASLRTELGNVTDSASMDKFIDNLKVARNKFQAEKAKYAQTSQEDKDQQQIYQNAIEAQEKLYNLKKQMVGVDPESSKGLELTRKLTDAQNEYNDALSQTNRQKLSIGQIQNIEDLEKQQKSELNEKRKEHVKKTAAQQEISDTEYLLSLYNDYTAAELKIKKMQSDTTGKSHKNEMATEIKNLQAAKRALMDLGIDVNNISGSELLTESEINALLEERVKYKKELQQIEDAAADKTETKANKEAQKYGKTIFNRESRYFDSINASVSSLGDVSFNPKFFESLEKYKTAYKELSDLRERFVNDPNAVNDDVLKNQFQESALNVSNLRKELNLLLNDHQKMANIPEESILGSMDIDIDKIGDARLAMIEFANTVTDGQFKFKGFNAAGTEMYGSISKGSNALEEITVSLSNVTNKMTAFTSGTKQVSSAWGKFGSEFKGEVKQLIGQYFGFYELFQAFRNGIGYVKEIDLAMTELKKVTNETDLTYENFLKDSSKTAANIGSTISDFTDATAAFARLGYTIEESANMAETAIVYKNVADGLDTVGEATDSIISTMMAFGIEASDTMSIVDKFNAVGNSFAITSAGIGDALQRSASALYTAGNTIDESVALVTAANSVIQNPEQVGTALKTLALRLRGAKVELEEAGLETENMAESTSQLQGKLLALTHGKVDIMKDAETFKNTTQILREMSKAWEDMTDIERASALELMGGRFCHNV